MRWIVVRQDEQGRSCVVRESGISRTPVPAVEASCIFLTSSSPPSPRPDGSGAVLDAGLEPGLARWSILRMPPSHDHPRHQTDTVDFDTVVAGSIELRLDDGVHQLGPGDCVVIDGADHAWRAGPEGCVLAVLMIGSARRARRRR
jgi:quercetin dioxygenase-like cupin family protein